MKQFIFLCLCILTWQVPAQVPVSQIEGYLEVYHPEDTTSLYLGTAVGRSVDNSFNRFSTIVGNHAGQSITTGLSNAFFGYHAGQFNTSGRANAFFGTSTGRFNMEGNFNAFFGHFAGYSCVEGSYNAFFGTSAGSSILGDSCIALGSDSGPPSGEGNVSKRLYIDVEKSNDPLIYGEFDNDLVRINGAFNIKEAKDTAGTIEGHIAQIFNTSSGTSPDVLSLKVGTPGNPGNGVNYITFYHGNDLAIGRVEGNGSGGVTYGTTGADYAEYLPVMDNKVIYRPGDLVGVYGGKISHHTAGAARVMVITDQAAVLGNVPDQKDDYQPVSFIGQIPVRVKGLVRSGDWIVASGYHDGVGMAVSTSDITLDDQIVGRAWESSTNQSVKRINTAVGLDQTEALMFIIKDQQEKIKLQHSINTDLQRQIDELKALIRI